MHLNTLFKIHVSVVLQRKMCLIIPLLVGRSFLFCGLNHLATSQCQTRNPLDALARCLAQAEILCFAFRADLEWGCWEFVLACMILTTVREASGDV